MFSISQYRLLLLSLTLSWICFSCKPNKSDATAADELAERYGMMAADAVGLDVEQLFEVPKGQRDEAAIRLSRTGYTVSYNTTWRIPNWVAYELTAAEAKAYGKRDGSFASDPAVGRYAAENSDYKGSGYSRGHMAPAGDMKWSRQAQHESFLLTNICPQDHDLNAGVWEDLESALRKYARKWGRVYIVCGPIVEDGYRTIGSHKVCVPQRFFKVVCWQKGGRWHCKAFVFPNQNVGGDYHDYSTTVDEVERLTNYDFFYQLPDNIEERIEAYDKRGEW
ncbi:MAG: DNA/RNA non-specific endonuclease [Bacteroidaceae bacterium]|nr:DNA/RNA non-specific endonuclease [Bacteroidaceae bacterium]